MHIDRDKNIRMRRNIMNSLLCSICQVNPKYYLKNGKLHYYCRECTKERGKIIYNKNKEKIYNNNIKIKYGVTPEEYNNLLLIQENKCAICSDLLFSKENIRKPAVDHDHLTGKVRGILCGKCNTGLGLFRDNIENFLKAVKYLQKV